METELISLAVIALLACITPLLARAIPHKLIPETVFLLFAGVICGPHLLGWIQVGDAISLLSDLGLGFLFLLAGYEIDPKNLSNYQGKRGFVTWIFTFAIAVLAVWAWPEFSLDGIDGLAVVIALTTTALGTLLPILKERNLMDTPIGNAVLSYGTWGELCPVIAMALLLSTRTTIQSMIILVMFALIAVAVAFLSSRLKNWDRISTAVQEGAETTQQTVVRATVLLMVMLTALSAVFNLDIVLGAFAAGFILRYIIPQGSKSLETKLDGLAFGFFIPLFFIVSGSNIDIHAVGDRPLLLVFFIVLLLLFRNYREPVVILLMIPLIFIGVVLGLAVTGKVFNFFSLLGLLGLVGMNIKNAVVLVGQVGVLRSEGKDAYEALTAATRSRIVPVAMASGTTILGMLPLLFDSMFGAMAATIMGGLLFSTFATLFFVPILYALFFKIRIDR
mgnify:CR=1 FL=1